MSRIIRKLTGRSLRTYRTEKVVRNGYVCTRVVGLR
jgi:hypothetical protein